MAMAVTCRASLALLSSLTSSSSSSHPHHRSLLMAASRSSHVGGTRDLLSAKQRLSSASSAKVAAPRAAVASPASSPGATSQGELRLPLIGCRLCVSFGAIVVYFDASLFCGWVSDGGLG